jgi:hypothetical protein
MSDGSTVTRVAVSAATGELLSSFGTMASRESECEAGTIE